MCKYIKLEDAIKAIGETAYYKEDRQIVEDGARAALEELDTIEVSEDCISRKAIMKYIADTQLGLNPYKEEDDYVKIVLDWIFDEVKNTSPVIPSRPRGEWIGISYDGYADGNPVYDEWECSNCGYETEEETRYCPNCGADMRGESE